MFHRFTGVTLAAATIIISGCATPQKFEYTAPSAELTSAGPRLAVVRTVDKRTGDRAIDRSFEPGYFLKFDAAVDAEMEATGVFSDVTTVSTLADARDADYVLQPEIIKLTWSVPNYEEVQGGTVAGAATAGVAGGLIGGVIAAGVMAAIPVDVDGDAVVNMRLEDRRDGTVVIESSYVEHCDFEKSVLTCDTDATKVEVTTEALRRALKAFADDVAETVPNHERSAQAKLAAE